jgi:hypothetical protein
LILSNFGSGTFLVGRSTTENKQYFILGLIKSFIWFDTSLALPFFVQLVMAISHVSLGLRGRVVKTSLSYHETSHLQHASVRILVGTMWPCESLLVYLRKVWTLSSTNKKWLPSYNWKIVQLEYGKLLQ